MTPEHRQRFEALVSRLQSMRLTAHRAVLRDIVRRYASSLAEVEFNDLTALEADVEVALSFMAESIPPEAMVNLTWAIAHGLVLRGASASRTGWHGAKVMAMPFGGLVLVVGDHRYRWEPHSVDLARPDWIAVLPAEDA